jgi:hypothetical protein
MPKFLARVTLNAEGARLLRQDKGSGRRAAVTRSVEAAGGRVEAFYFAYGGRHDHHRRLPRRGVRDRRVARGEFNGRRACHHDAAHHGRGNGPGSRESGDATFARTGTLT